LTDNQALTFSSGMECWYGVLHNTGVDRRLCHSIHELAPIAIRAAGDLPNTRRDQSYR